MVVVAELPAGCGGLPCESELELMCGLGWDGVADLVAERRFPPAAKWAVVGKGA